MPEDQELGIDDSKLMAVMAYLGILVLVPLFTRRQDPFVYFHTKQGVVLLVGFIMALVLAAWVNLLGNILFLLLLLLDVVGLVQALLGRRWKIPIIGQIAEAVRI